MLPDDDKRYAIETCKSSESVLKKWFKINDIQLVHLLVMWYLVNLQDARCNNKDKVVPVHALKVWGGVEVKLHSFLTSTQTGSRASSFILGTHRVGTRWRSWLKLCATIRKVVCSIPDGVIWIFHSLNPSGISLGGGGRRPVRRADNLTTFMCWLSRNVWSLNLQETQRACQGL